MSFCVFRVFCGSFRFGGLPEGMATKSTKDAKMNLNVFVPSAPFVVQSFGLFSCPFVFFVAQSLR